jgi:peptidoglycan hydrolase CwlO-like protein
MRRTGKIIGYIIAAAAAFYVINSLNTANQKVEALESSVSSLSGKIEEVGTKVDSLESKLDEIDTKIDNLPQ